MRKIILDQCPGGKSWGSRASGNLSRAIFAASSSKLTYVSVAYHWNSSTSITDA
jgi:hypothetical protein